MMEMKMGKRPFPVWLVLLCLLFLVACGGQAEVEPETALSPLSLPQLDPVALDSAPLQVVATTSIIGDVVAQVGGEAIALTTLIAPGQDPHSFEPSAQALTAVANAHVIFINGWDLEEALVYDLEEIGEGVPLVAISANIEPLTLGDTDHEGDEDEDDHVDSGVDPHVWLAVPNVIQWVENVAQVLSDLDPANAETYERNAAVYLAELQVLEDFVTAELATIPVENRFLVTNHDSLSYFAQAYDFIILDTVLPGNSSLAEPSASDLTALIQLMAEHKVCTIFTETTVSSSLAETAAGELANCDVVQVLPLYTGAIGSAGSGADSYIGMFRANVAVILEGVTR